MAAAREQATTPVSTYDYLDEDEPIRRQNFACVSFLSPEDVIEDRKMFIMKDFLSSFSVGMNDLVEHIRTKFPIAGEELDAIKQAHPTIFKQSEIGAELVTYASVHKEDLEKKFEAAHKFTTSVRGVKVRGAFNTREEAERHIKSLRARDPNFDIFLCEIGKWCPWDPCAEDVGYVDYKETHLNTLMKGYKSNIDNRDEAYEGDTRDRVQKVKDHAALNAPSTVIEEVADSAAAEAEAVSAVTETETDSAAVLTETDSVVTETETDSAAVETKAEPDSATA